MGLWYSKDSGFELTGFSDADYARFRDAKHPPLTSSSIEAATIGILAGYITNDEIAIPAFFIWNNDVTDVESGHNVGGGSKTKLHDGGSGAKEIDEGQRADKGMSVNEYLVKTFRLEDEDVAVDAATGLGKTLAFVVLLVEILRRTNNAKPHEVRWILVLETTHDKLQKYKEGKPVLHRSKIYGPDGNNYWVRHEAHIGETDEDDYENGQGNDLPLCENNDDPDAIWRAGYISSSIISRDIYIHFYQEQYCDRRESGDSVGGGSKVNLSHIRREKYKCKLKCLQSRRFKKSSPKLLCTYKDVVVDAATGSGKTLAFVFLLVEILSNSPRDIACH
ncbi:yippee-like protein [Tanacetum coccineum]